jgi:glycolate oxidase FAD binding subunit
MRPDDGIDLTDVLVARVQGAHAARTPLRIVGGDSKRFYGRPVAAEPLHVGGHRGVVRYDPAELVVTVRAGTPLVALETLLRGSGQCLPFEPPHFGATATIGGCVAAGLAGPARVARGPVRDYVLGARVLTGDGRVLRFGGEVMKNVAGYDIARLLAGSLGVLAVLLDVSLKVLPEPASRLTLLFELDAAAAIDRLAAAVQRGVPITASFWHGGRLHVRLAAAPASLERLHALLGGEQLAAEAADRFWADVREQRHPFFAAGDRPLWREHAAAVAPFDAAAGDADCAFEWNGAQRWYRAPRPARDTWTCFRSGTGPQGPDDGDVFPPLPDALLRLHREVKRVFDPAAILNPGRLYSSL